MKKFFLYVLFFGFTLIQLKSQTVDFYRIGNQIMPILGESYLQSSNHTTLGILIQESQWLDDSSFYIFSIWQNVPSHSRQQQTLLRQGHQAFVEDPRVQAK